MEKKSCKKLGSENCMDSLGWCDWSCICLGFSLVFSGFEPDKRCIKETI